MEILLCCVFIPNSISVIVSDQCISSSTGMYLSGIVQSKKVHSGQLKNIGENKSVRDLPSKFDWSTKNVIGPILDQQKVNSFATVDIVWPTW